MAEPGENYPFRIGSSKEILLNESEKKFDLAKAFLEESKLDYNQGNYDTALSRLEYSISIAPEGSIVLVGATEHLATFRESKNAEMDKRELDSLPKNRITKWEPVKFPERSLNNNQNKAGVVATSGTGTPNCITVGDYFAAKSEVLFDEAMELSVNNDFAALKVLMSTDQVFILKAGVKVFAKSQGVFSGKVKIRLPGTTTWYWTKSEAVRTVRI